MNQYNKNNKLKCSKYDNTVISNMNLKSKFFGMKKFP